jgi:chemotaxis regulatin CheY-phosphate phosphatase CheZ
MNERQRELTAKVGRLTQKLETGVIDPTLSAAENARAEAELKSIAARLVAVIPKPALSAEERVERMARAVSHATPDLDKIEPASHVLARLKPRIDELVPDGDLTMEEKVDKLGDIFRAAFAQNITDAA